MAKRSVQNIVDDWGLPRLGKGLFIDKTIRLQSLIVLFETIKADKYSRSYAESAQFLKMVNKYCRGRSTDKWVIEYVGIDIKKAISLVYGEAVIGSSQSAEENQEKNKQYIETAQAQAKDFLIAEAAGKEEAAKEIEKARYKEYVPNPDLLKKIEETFGNAFSTEPGNDEDIL